MEEFICKWVRPRFFSVVNMKNMKTLFKNLGIELIDFDEERIGKYVFVTFKLSGTKEQQDKLKKYMKTIHKWT